MATARELIFKEQFAALKEIAESRSWPLERTDVPGFILGLSARDGEKYWLKADCDGFSVTPPAWHWYNPETEEIDQTKDTPQGSGFLHGSERICAPWNRIAYQQVDPKGPHPDWDLANWMSNPKTFGCTTLAAMALRLHVELNGPRYKKRTE